jgi:thiamine pyrophosphokinase
VTTGLVWPLAGEDLEPGSTRGISNEMASAVATIDLTAGIVLIIHERNE